MVAFQQDEPLNLEGFKCRSLLTEITRVNLVGRVEIKETIPIGCLFKANLPFSAKA